MLKRIFNAWAVRAQTREYDELLARLRAMDDEEIGFFVAIVTDVRYQAAQEDGVDLLEPLITLALKPAYLFQFSLQTKRAKTTDPVRFGGYVVWLFTLRSMADYRLRDRGRVLWKELSRGYPHVEDSALNHFLLLGQKLRVDHFDQVPKGLAVKTSAI